MPMPEQDAHAPPRLSRARGIQDGEWWRGSWPAGRQAVGQWVVWENKGMNNGTRGWENTRRSPATPSWGGGGLGPGGPLGALCQGPTGWTPPGRMPEAGATGCGTQFPAKVRTGLADSDTGTVKAIQCLPQVGSHGNPQRPGPPLSGTNSPGGPSGQRTGWRGCRGVKAKRTNVVFM